MVWIKTPVLVATNAAVHVPKLSLETCPVTPGRNRVM